MPYVPGNAVEAFCAECKSDTVHTVLEVDGLQVRLVRCEKCNEEGAMRMPRSRTKEGLRDVAQKRREKTEVKKRARRRTKTEDPAQVFRKLIEGKDLSAAADYSIRIDLEEGQVIRHAKFGVGVVMDLPDPKKANIVFEDGPRIMACSMT